MAARTREAYAQHVASYSAWLGDRSGGEAALADPRARDYAARDFKRCLKAERRWKPASVNLALAAVDHFNRFLGLGPANVKREPLAQAAPRALSEEQQRVLLRAAEASRARDRAIVVLLLYGLPVVTEQKRTFEPNESGEVAASDAILSGGPRSGGNAHSPRATLRWTWAGRCPVHAWRLCRLTVPSTSVSASIGLRRLVLTLEISVIPLNWLRRWAAGCSRRRPRATYG